jgi:phosphohistidine phosphatase
MRTLYLIRHAKSSWDDLSIDDFDRPLNKKGKNDIRLMSKRLKEKNIFPDIIISSSAKRTKKTSEKICKIL